MSLISPPRVLPIAVWRNAASSIKDNLDDETAALIARLGLEDIEEVLHGRKGKGRAGSPLSDQEYAFQVQSEHYKHLIALAEDTKIARSIGDAMTKDTAYLEAFAAAEAAAVEDRRVAKMLSRGERLPEPNAIQARLEDPAFVMHPDSSLADPDLGSGGATAIDESSQTSLSITAVPKMSDTAGPSVNRNKNVNCTICDEQILYMNSLHTLCDHYYCKDCVNSLVDAFTRDESLFPLRCCQKSIPISDIIPFISTTLREHYEEKHVEFSVPSEDRVYCVSPTCFKFLGSSKGITSSGIDCPQCQASTCPGCKQASHEGDDCVVNAATIELHALANRERWQTCPGCHALVELNLGCYHITCRCRTQFCYLCAVRWKNCECPRWEETRTTTVVQQRA